MQAFDLAIIGTGISGMASLKSILSAVQAQPLGKVLHIAVIEKQETLWNGVAFGAQPSVNSLIITSLAEFISDEERAPFIAWLNQNYTKIMEAYAQAGGATAHQWIEQYQQAISNSQWNDIYIPRYWYKDYLAESLNELIQALVLQGKIQLTHVFGEAINITPLPGPEYNITINALKAEQNITAVQVVLAIGSPPAKRLIGVNVPPGFAYIKSMYVKPAVSNLEAIAGRLKAIPKVAERNLLLVGSNACCIELLYLIAHHEELSGLINHVTILSTSGALPLPVNNLSATPSSFTYLNLLSNQAAFTYAQLIEATVADLKQANLEGVNAQTVGMLVNQAMQLQQQLTEDDKILFKLKFGPIVSANIRRMGKDYGNAVNRLIKEQKLTLLKGKFHQLKSTGNATALLTYADEKGQLHNCHTPFAALINSTGFETLNQCTSPLINNLHKTQLCRVNATQRGFEVNEQFEAAKNFYIMGPLLAGNNNATVHFWHVENVDRILRLSALMSQQILNRYTVGRYVTATVNERPMA